MNLTFSGVVSNGRVAEANIQAEFYMLCRRHGIQILLEVKHESCRFDAVVFLNDRPFAIIEVKNYGVKCSARGIKRTGRQYLKYSKYNLPLIEVLNSGQIKTKFNELQKMIQDAEY